MPNFITHGFDGIIKPKRHFEMLREACPPEDVEELDNIINTYDSLYS